MIRLIKIEFMKLKNTRFFWVFTLLFAVCLLAVPIGAMLMLNYVTVEMGAELSGIGLNDLPLFDFVDIWQNLSYLYKWPAILLAFIPVISMANEYRYGTIKQNIIDGLSRNELLLSKILFSAVLSIAFGIALLLIGFGMGFTYSPVTGASYILKHIDFVFAFIVVLFGYQLFCLFITTLIKKSGITILLILFYFFALEAIAYGVIAWDYKMPELTNLLPLRGMSNIVSNPFPKYILKEVHSTVQLSGILITLGHISLYTFLSFWIFNKRDIR